MKIITATLAILAALILGPSPADAADPRADHHPCVANREANSSRLGTGRTDLEAAWEVTGQGHPFYFPWLDMNMVAYRWCGHGPLTRAWVGVTYNANRRMTYVIEYDYDRQAPGTPMVDYVGAGVFRP